MSYISVQGERSTEEEISALDNLTDLAISGASQAIRKTGTNTFANVDVGSGSGSGFTLLPATGTINSINTTFTFTEQPDYIISDGAWYRVNKGWTWSGSTATMTIPPSDDLYGFT